MKNIQVAICIEKNNVFSMFPEDAKTLEQHGVLTFSEKKGWSSHSNMGKSPVYTAKKGFTVVDRDKHFHKITPGSMVKTRPSMVN